MYVRVVFFMCDGRQLLDEMNVHSLLHCHKEVKGGQLQPGFFSSKIGAFYFFAWLRVFGGTRQPRLKVVKGPIFSYLGPAPPPWGFNIDTHKKQLCSNMR